jgi:GH43 family beta-xylosidase
MGRLTAPLLFGLLLTAGNAYTQEDPFNGSWRLNVEKSKMQPRTFSKSETVVYRVSDNTEIYTSDVITGEGEHEVTQYNARYNDDKEYPSTVTVYGQGSSRIQTTNLMLRKIDERTRERVYKRDGRITTIMRRNMSADGKTITSSIMSVDANGKENVFETRVFEKIENSLAQQDPFNGTWKLNVAKSRMQPATASKSEIIHYEIAGDEEKFVSQAVTAKDEAESIQYSARYNDGKPYPFTITINGKIPIRTPRPSCERSISGRANDTTCATEKPSSPLAARFRKMERR